MVQFLTGHRLVPVHGSGVGDTWIRGFLNEKEGKSTLGHSNRGHCGFSRSPSGDRIGGVCGLKRKAGTQSQRPGTLASPGGQAFSALLPTSTCVLDALLMCHTLLRVSTWDVCNEARH